MAVSVSAVLVFSTLFLREVIFGIQSIFIITEFTKATNAEW